MKNLCIEILKTGFKCGLSFGNAVKVSHLHKAYVIAIIYYLENMVASEWFAPMYLPLVCSILYMIFLKEEIWYGQKNALKLKITPFSFLESDPGVVSLLQLIQK